MIREKGFASGRIEGMIIQRIEGIPRTLFTLMVTEPGSLPLAAAGEDLEIQLLQALLPMQCLNNQYREELKRTYDIASEFDEELMNNKVYGVVTDGTTWIFLQYEQQYSSVTTRIVAQHTVEVKTFFLSLHEVVKTTINLCSDLIYNRSKPITETR